MRDLIDNQAELGSDEDDESFDDEPADRPRKEREGRIEDSSDEEEDDDDEEEARKVTKPAATMALKQFTYRILDPGRLHCRRRRGRRRRGRFRRRCTICAEAQTRAP